jgi:quinol monooxygenase YgiN
MLSRNHPVGCRNFELARQQEHNFLIQMQYYMAQRWNNDISFEALINY